MTEPSGDGAAPSSPGACVSLSINRGFTGDKPPNVGVLATLATMLMAIAVVHGSSQRFAARHSARFESHQRACPRDTDHTDAFFRKWLRRLPHPFTADDRRSAPMPDDEPVLRMTLSSCRHPGRRTVQISGEVLGLPWDVWHEQMYSTSFAGHPSCASPVSIYLHFRSSWSGGGSRRGERTPSS